MKSRFQQYKSYRYDESFSMMPLSAQQAMRHIRGRESDAWKLADSLDWDIDRSGNWTAEYVTDDGYRIEFTAYHDDCAEIDWDIDPDTIESLIPHYHGHVSKSVAREWAEHLIEAQIRHKEKMMSGQYYSAMVFSAEVYDPEENLIGEDSIGGCWIETMGDEDSVSCLSDYTVHESLATIREDREARDFESRYMVA